MSIEKRASELVDRFSSISDWEDRYKEIINIGRQSEALGEHELEDKYLVKGCQSKVWLIPSYNQGRIKFKVDSDAAIVKGIVNLLAQVYSNASPEEIIKYQDDFLGQIGIKEHLSMNRTNGLAAMHKQIKMYAIAYASLAEKGIMDAP